MVLGLIGDQACSGDKTRTLKQNQALSGIFGQNQAGSGRVRAMMSRGLQRFRMLCFEGMQLFCLLLGASCLQLSFFAYSYVLGLFCLQLEFFAYSSSFLLTARGFFLTVGECV